jgi:hypothetical protein
MNDLDKIKLKKKNYLKEKSTQLTNLSNFIPFETSIKFHR